MADESDDASEASSQKLNNNECINDQKIDKSFACCARKCTFFVCAVCEKIFHRFCARKENIRFIGGYFINCCQQQESDNRIISQKSEKEAQVRTSQVFEMKLLEVKIRLLSQLLESANEKNEILKLNNALLLQRIQSMEVKSISIKKNKQDTSGNDDNFPIREYIGN
ncbi:hypothetical protein WA026_021756 [Henosepilachna vigintioctopunctata]|uniref:Uncharacterized protein n=1 Tax=Henosepilachna vigintioctopunctata TaxID=420089 RepID=A0AAW1TP32_9CUCU